MKQKILCIEDDATIQTLVSVALPDFEVIAAKTLQEADLKLRTNKISALLLDIELPDGDGLRYLSDLYSRVKEKTPVLILSQHQEIQSKVMAFSLGADDYIGKPFDPIELNIRLQSKIKKQSQVQDEFKCRKIGDLLLDFDRQKAYNCVDGEEKDLGLTNIELKILGLLTKRLEQVFSREQILEQVWQETHITDRTVDSHVAHLRQKISDSSVCIETVKSLGYRSALRK